MVHEQGDMIGENVHFPSTLTPKNQKESRLLTRACRSVPQVLHHSLQWDFPVCAADSIEANVENAEAHVQSGTQQLARASDYQVKHNKGLFVI